MLLLNPETVRFEDLLWEDAFAPAIDREAARLVEEWSDAGPYQAFADIPDAKTIIRVARRLVADDRANDAAMHVGRTGTLAFYPSTERSDAPARLLPSTSCSPPSAPNSAAHQPHPPRSANNNPNPHLHRDLDRQRRTDPITIEDAMLID